MLNFKAIFFGFLAALCVMHILSAFEVSKFLTGWLCCMSYTMTHNYIDKNDKVQG